MTGRGYGELAAGGVVPSEVVRKMACDARISWITRDRRGVVGIGRARRHIPPAMMNHLRKRDGGCRFPGCGCTRYLHAHHKTHWVNGGLTELPNLILVCHRHHALLHEGGWNAIGNPEPGPGPGSTLQFIRPDGSVYLPIPTQLLQAELPHGPAPDNAGPAPASTGAHRRPPAPQHRRGHRRDAASPPVDGRPAYGGAAERLF